MSARPGLMQPSSLGSCEQSLLVLAAPLGLVVGGRDVPDLAVKARAMHQLIHPTLASSSSLLVFHRFCLTRERMWDPCATRRLSFGKAIAFRASDLRLQW